MKIKALGQVAQAAAAACLAALFCSSRAEDIDIFVSGSGGAGAPNVLIILDNSSNWSAANQAWPTDAAPPVPCANDCNKQGYYELKAIRSVIQALAKDEAATDELTMKDIPINLGLMLFNNSSAVRDGGYIRYHVRPMTKDNLVGFLKTIDTIISHFNTETAASSVQYAAALFDAFKYFGGYTNPDNATADTSPGTKPSYEGVHVFGTQYWGSRLADGEKPDDAAYSWPYYKPPNTSDCGRNHIIFIGNGFPAKDNTTPDMGEVLSLLLKPSQSPSNISEFEYLTYIPVLGKCSPVSDASCTNTCTTDDYTDSAYPEVQDHRDDDPEKWGDAFIHQCSKDGCKGGKEQVVACPITTWNDLLSVPEAEAANRYADEYADFLHKTDVSSLVGQQNVTVHAINVFRAKPDANQDALMRSMAFHGGGLYLAASSLAELEAAIGDIFSEILSVNSTFASASLPVNATSRAQNENQVYIGMFRPDADAKPRWFGNLKRFRLGIFDNQVRLADVSGKLAVNTQTGFVTDCATSWWTTDSGGWWEAYPINPTAGGACKTTEYDPFSDSPDGPQVEKGAVAEVIRKGNKPPGTDTTPTWIPDRVVYTLQESNNSLTDFSATNSGLDESLVNFIEGHDVMDEDQDGNREEVRASLHGPVIHSRALPITYREAGIKVIYGANDATLRMVDAETGKEDWAFVAPEFAEKAKRLMENSPPVKYPGSSSDDAKPFSYYFDGSIGLYQEEGDSKVWVFPTMRRGGNSLYAFDVKAPGSPEFMWRVSPSSPGFVNLGQTWSHPNVARLDGYVDIDGNPKPVIVMGGGYDGCEDQDSKSPDCGDGSDPPEGAAVYVLDAESGALLRSFATRRSVAADVSLVDTDYDGNVDFAYAADAGGNIYRLTFARKEANQPIDTWAQGWTFHRIAYTDGDGRKFLFGPALLPTKDESGKDWIYLAIGSGDREHPLKDNYPYSDVINRFYVLLDDPGSSATARDLDDVSLEGDGTAMRDFTDPKTTSCDEYGVLPGSGYRGWFIDLGANGKGEQTVTSALIAGAMVTFSTNRPLAPAEDAPCRNPLGEARGYWMNLLNGSGAIEVEGNCGGQRSATFIGGGLPPSPVFAKVPITVTDENGKTKITPVTVVIGAVQKGGSDGSVVSSGIDGQEVRPTITFRRQRTFWQEEHDE